MTKNLAETWDGGMEKDHISCRRKPFGGDGMLVEPIRGCALKQGRMKGY
jgi:hypothetical protein